MKSTRLKFNGSMAKPREKVLVPLEMSEAFHEKTKQELNRLRGNVEQSLKDEIKSMLDDEMHTDLLLTNGTDVVHAHKCILQIRSKYFWQDEWVTKKISDDGKELNVIEVQGLNGQQLEDFVRQLYTVGDSLWLFEEYHHFFPGSLKLSQDSEESCKAQDGQENIEESCKAQDGQEDSEESCKAQDGQEDSEESCKAQDGQGTCHDPSGQGENCAWDSSDKINSVNQIEEELEAGQENKVSEEIGGSQPGVLELNVCLAADTRTSDSCDETALVEHSGGVDAESDLADECLEERKADLTDKLLDVEETLQGQPKECGSDDIWAWEQDVQQRERNSDGPESETKVAGVTTGGLTTKSDSRDELARRSGQADVSTNHDGCNSQAENYGNTNFNRSGINPAMVVSESELSVTGSAMSVIDSAMAETGSTMPVTDSLMSVASSAMVVTNSDMAVTSSEKVVNAADTTTNPSSDFSQAIKSSYSFSVPYETCSPLGHDLLQMYLQELDCDCCLAVDGVQFHVHKCVMSARSEYFQAMLGGQWCESHMEIINLEGVTPQAVEQLLLFLYGGVIELTTPCDLMDLFIAADMYSILTLKNVLAFYVRRDLCHFFHKPCLQCVNTAGEALNLCHNFDLGDEQGRILKWVAKYFTKIWPTKTFASLPDGVHHMSVEGIKSQMTAKNVLDIIMECNKLTTSLPRIKWTESILGLLTQLMDMCIEFTSVNFTKVISTQEFHQWAKVASWKAGALEDIFNSVIDSLPIETACHVFQTLIHLEAFLSSLDSSDLDVVGLLQAMIKRCEKFFKAHIHQVMRSKEWFLLPKSIQSRIMENSAYLYLGDFAGPQIKPPAKVSLRLKQTTSLDKPLKAGTPQLGRTPSAGNLRKGNQQMKQVSLARSNSTKNLPTKEGGVTQPRSKERPKSFIHVNGSDQTAAGSSKTTASSCTLSYQPAKQRKTSFTSKLSEQVRTSFSQSRSESLPKDLIEKLKTNEKSSGSSAAPEKDELKNTMQPDHQKNSRIRVTYQKSLSVPSAKSESLPSQNESNLTCSQSQKSELGTNNRMSLSSSPRSPRQSLSKIPMSIRSPKLGNRSRPGSQIVDSEEPHESSPRLGLSLEGALRVNLEAERNPSLNCSVNIKTAVDFEAENVDNSAESKPVFDSSVENKFVTDRDNLGKTVDSEPIVDSSVEGKSLELGFEVDLRSDSTGDSNGSISARPCEIFMSPLSYHGSSHTSEIGFSDTGPTDSMSQLSSLPDIADDMSASWGGLHPAQSDNFPESNNTAEHSLKSNITESSQSMEGCHASGRSLLGEVEIAAAAGVICDVKIIRMSKPLIVGFFVPPE